MNKLNLKSLIIGGIIGASIMTASGAFAAVGDKVEAIFAEFNIVLNGNSVVLDETPLVYNGTSYLPVRSLSNALGLDVTYKADSRTIELSSSGTLDGENTNVDKNNLPTPTDNSIDSSNIRLSNNHDTIVKDIEAVKVEVLDDIEYYNIHLLGTVLSEYGYLIQYDQVTNSLFITYNEFKNFPLDKNVIIQEGMRYKNHPSNGDSYIMKEDVDNLLIHALIH
jgi:hypothetical protein